jgi:hypothetical protein
MSPDALGAVIGATERDIRRWEGARSEPIPEVADRIVRKLYVPSI